MLKTKETRAEREAREEKEAKALRVKKRKAREARLAAQVEAEESKPRKKLKIEPKIVLPKKLTKTRALALANEPNKISRIKKDDEISSILGDSAETIQQLLETDKNESASTMLQKRLLQSLVDLVSYAESNVRATKGQKGVYQVNSLITSIREILSDMQANRDRSAIGHALIEKVMRPMFMDIGMELVKEESRLMGEVKNMVDFGIYKEIKVRHSEATTRIATVMKQKYETACSETIKFLQA